MSDIVLCKRSITVDYQDFQIRECVIHQSDVDRFIGDTNVTMVYFSAAKCSSYELLDVLLSHLQSLEQIDVSLCNHDDEMIAFITKWIKRVKRYVGPCRPWVLDAIKESSLVDFIGGYQIQVDMDDLFRSIPPTLQFLEIDALAVNEDSWDKIITFLRTDTRLIQFDFPGLGLFGDITDPRIVEAVRHHPTLQRCCGYDEFIDQSFVPKDILRHIFTFVK
jgi:hypothetical protein